MRRELASLISVGYSFLKFSIIKLFHWKSFKFDVVERFSPRTVLEIDRGILWIGKKVRAHTGTIIKVRQDGEMHIGDNVSFNYNCIVVCRDSIIIGNGVEFGPGCQVFDHDHDFRVAGGIKANKYTTGKIIVGDNSWIGAGTIILKGSKIGKDCIIGAGSIIKGNIPDGSIVIQKRS